MNDLKPDQPGRDAARLDRIPLKGWWQIVQRVAMKAGHDNLSVVSAGCAYYALFAIFPALTASISLYGLTADPATVERQFDILEAVLPPQAYDIFIDQVRRIAETSDQTLGWSFVVSILIALWSTNLGIQAMFAALNIAYGEPERRSILRFYLDAIAYTIIGILGGVVMLFVIVYVPVLVGNSGHPEAYETLIRILRWPLFVLFTLTLLALIYRFGPSRRNPKWRWLTVGSVFAALVWFLASLGFSYYVSNFANYDRMYGSLGAVVILLFWLYISFYIVLMGAEINAQVERQIEGDTSPDAPKPRGKRGVYVAAGEEEG